VLVQWDLVCDDEYLKDLSQTILTVGVMFGALGFTTLSDYIGRKPVFLFSQWAMVVVGVITAFVPNYYVFLVLRFFTGAFQQVPTKPISQGVGYVSRHSLVEPLRNRREPNRVTVIA